jgi:hypothetical protein
MAISRILHMATVTTTTATFQFPRPTFPSMAIDLPNDYVDNRNVSTADLPFPSMAIYLPNDYVVRWPISRFTYARDKSVCTARQSSN